MISESRPPCPGIRTQASKRPELVKMLQNPVRLKRDLQAFRKAAKALSSNHPRLIARYPNEWVAVYRGKVAVHGPTLNAVLGKMKQKKIPQEQTIVRYIEKTRRTMILLGVCLAVDSATPLKDPMSKRWSIFQD